MHGISLSSRFIPGSQMERPVPSHVTLSELPVEQVVVDVLPIGMALPNTVMELSVLAWNPCCLLSSLRNKFMIIIPEEGRGDPRNGPKQPGMKTAMAISANKETSLVIS